MADPDSSNPRVEKLLRAAVEGLGGSERPGQVTMANAVTRAMDEGEHLLVQAGTGTGKSLGYLVPAFAYAARSDQPVVVATATLALQAQLVGRDLPALVESLGAELENKPTYAILKGRHNYACLYRVNDGVPDEQGQLVEVRPTGTLGRSVVELREWAKKQADSGGSGDKDAAPTHNDKAWNQVSVSSRECLGDKCAYVDECFAERARADAMTADVVVTNHALLAIDTMDSFTTVLPDHQVVVVDEAHELAARVTGAASAQLSPQMVERTARRAAPYCEGDEADPLEDAGDALKAALKELTGPGRIVTMPADLAEAVATVRDSARAALSALPKSSKGDAEAGLRTARTLLDNVHAVAERIASWSPYDVIWMNDRETFGQELEVAPLSVAGLLRERLFAEKTCVLTSATLELGGTFDSTARSVGLRPSDRIGAPDQPTASGRTTATDRQATDGQATSGLAATPDRADAPDDSGESTSSGESTVEPIPWRGIDVGSPFDYARQAILYVARRLPAPGRGISAQALEELSSLVGALGGRTLGLFSSRRAAEEAADFVRDRLGLTILCQGDAQLPELGRRFIEEADSSLFGTLSLWQGLDVPGDTCRLVVIDRLPFPRPDDPLMSARQRAVDEAGGNGFMAVAASHAALLLAQGVGRLIRRSTDRGVVAILDSRLATARYGGYMRASLPPMWYTVDRDVVVGALGRLRSNPPSTT